MRGITRSGMSLLTVVPSVLRVAGLLFLCVSPCMSQEAPFYNTPKFDTSAMHRTDLCGRQNQLFGGNITLEDALRGLNLSVVFTNYQDPGSQPFFTLNSEGVIDEENPGLMAVIMDELAERAGFSWRNSYGAVLPIDPNTDGDKTWSDLLRWEVDTYDISAGKWDRSPMRMKNGTSFPEGWYDSSMIMIHSKSDDSSTYQLNVWGLFLPFKWGVWVLIVVVVIVSGAVYYFLEKMNSETDEREFEHDAAGAFFYTAITFTGHFEFRPLTLSAMILTFSLTFVALFIAAVYTANLASFLVARYQPPFGVDTVEKAVMAGFPICIQGRVNIDDYLSYKYPDAVLIRQQSNGDVFRALKAGECTVAVVPVSEYEQFKRDSEVNGDCSLQWQGRVEEIVPSGFALEVDSGTLCTSLVSHVLDLHLVQMRAEGFVDRVWEDFLQQTGEHNCIEAEALSGSSGGGEGDGRSSEDETFSLGIQEMAGIFIIHAILMGLAVVVAVVQWRHKKWKEQKARLETVGMEEGLSDQEGTDESLKALEEDSDMNFAPSKTSKGPEEDSDDVNFAPSIHPSCSDSVTSC